MLLNSDTKHVAAEIAVHPKSAWLATLVVNWAALYVEWVSPVVSALTSIGSFVLIILLVRYHLKNSKKLDQDIEIGHENLKQMRRKEDKK